MPNLWTGNQEGYPSAVDHPSSSTDNRWNHGILIKSNQKKLENSGTLNL